MDERISSHSPHSIAFLIRIRHDSVVVDSLKVEIGFNKSNNLVRKEQIHVQNERTSIIQLPHFHPLTPILPFTQFALLTISFKACWSGW